jgi:peptide/nickel transport system substrate-binding protein
LVAAACVPTSKPKPASPVLELKVGFAGANVAGGDFGIAQFLPLLTLESLTFPGVDGRPTPRLAETWSWENDALTLRVKLRAGVKFHDGTALTSAVAADILERALKRPATLARYPTLGDVAGIRTAGDREILIDLSRRSAWLPEDLDFQIESGERYNGTGPYRLVQNDGSGLTLLRFDPYYLGKPTIGRIVVRQFDALRPAWSSLLRGEVDMVSDVPSDAAQFIGNDDVRVISFTRGYQYVIAFNSRRAPFDSAVVRRALNVAIDRDRLIKTRIQGAAVAATGPIWPKHWAYDSAIRPFVFDTKLATTTLESAGFRVRPSPDSARPPARLRFTCLIPSGYAVLERIGLEVQKQLYDIGVDLKFEMLSPAAYGERVARGDFDAMLTDIISGPSLVRPYLFWHSAKESKGFNVFGYENSEAERLFQVLRTDINEAAVRSATRRLQQVMLDDPPALFLAWSERSRAIRRDFGVVVEPDRDPMLTLWRWTTDNAMAVASTQ